jgi:hypothetical protein
MRRMPPRERPRRGACAWGSRKARAGAAACLVAFVLTLGVPGPALAYRCEDPPPPVSLPHPELPGPERYAAPTSTECRVPDAQPPKRTKKRGSVSGLTVFVLAVAAVLLIPIGARGIPASVDPYREDRSNY